MAFHTIKVGKREKVSIEFDHSGDEVKASLYEKNVPVDNVVIPDEVWPAFAKSLMTGKTFFAADYQQGEKAVSVNTNVDSAGPKVYWLERQGVKHQLLLDEVNAFWLLKLALTKTKQSCNADFSMSDIIEMMKR